MRNKWILTGCVALLAIHGWAMSITVEIVDGGAFPLDVAPADTIGQVKQQIENEQGVPPEDQTLMFAGQELADDQPLTDLGIEEGGTLQLNVAGFVTDPGEGDDSGDPGDQIDPGDDPGGDPGVDPGDDPTDSDGDGIDDRTDTDDDGDGVPDVTVIDEDGDGIPDVTITDDGDGPLDVVYATGAIGDTDTQTGEADTGTAPVVAPQAKSSPSSPEYVDRLESGIRTFVHGVQAQGQAGE
jgi:hypothetical protein